MSTNQWWNPLSWFSPKTTAPTTEHNHTSTEPHTHATTVANTATTGGTSTDLIDRTLGGTIITDAVNTVSTIASGVVQTVVSLPSTLVSEVTMDVKPAKKWDLFGSIGQLFSNFTSNLLQDIGELWTDVVEIFTPSGENKSFLGQIVEPIVDLVDAATTAVLNIIPSTDNTTGELIRDAFNVADQAIYSVPKLLTIGDIPVISTIGDAASALVGGAADMADIVLDHAIMITGGLADNAENIIDGAANIVQDLANNPLDIVNAVIINDSAEIDSIGDIIRNVNEQKFNELYAHVTHDAQLIDEIPETAAQIAAGIGNDLGLGFITNPVINALNGAVDFVIHDVVADGIIGTGFDIWYEASELLLGDNAINTLNGPGTMSSEEHTAHTELDENCICCDSNVDTSGHSTYVPLAEYSLFASSDEDHSMHQHTHEAAWSDAVITTTAVL